MTSLPRAEVLSPGRCSTELSVVMPCYNESDGIETVLRSWIEGLHQLLEDRWEIIVINDGSIDGTARVLDRLRKENRAVRIIHQLHGGAEHAARRGIELARGRYVAQVNGDGRVAPEDFFPLWQQRNRASLVLGARRLPPGRWVQRACRRLVRSAIQFLFHVRLDDAATPFRLMHRSIIIEALRALPATYPSPNTALAIRLASEGAGITEIAIEPRRRPLGPDRSEDRSLIPHTIGRLIDLIYLRLSVSRQWRDASLIAVPLR